MQIDNRDNASDNSHSNVDNNNSDTGNANTSNNDSGNDGIDAAFAKHLDIAIEAQDGKSPKPDANTSTTDNNQSADNTGQSGDQQSSTRDGNTQPKPDGKDPKVAEAARTLARAKDITLADGSVIRGGAERRFYEQRETARQQLSVEQHEHQNTRQQLEQVTRERDIIRQTTETLHGMDPQEVRLGATIVSDLKRDPVGTMKKLLAETIAQGYTIDDIGKGVDGAAMQRLLDERLPRQQQTETKTEEQIVTEARNEVTQFYSSFPDARPHDALIGRVLQDHPQLSLQDVYFQLKNSFAEKGFDWSRSLQDNLQEMSSQQPNAGGNQNNQQNNGNARPLPNGRGANDGEFKLNTSGAANEDLDTSDIVKQAMRESGLNI